MGTMIYTCSVCDVKYGDANLLSLHTQAMHPAPIVPVLLGTCPVCLGNVFSDERHVGPHASQQPNYAYVHEACAPTTTRTVQGRWATWPNWCDEGFGVQYREDGKMLFTWACRLPKGHDGDHDCQAAEEWRKDHPSHDAPIKPKARSAAARAVFGGR